MEQNPTFQQIKESVALPDLLLHHGYQLKKEEDLGKGKWHVFEGNDTLVVFKGQGGDWLYFNSQDDRDKGNVVDWMKNRVGTGRIPSIEQLPGRNLWQSVNDHFRAYLDLPEAARPQLALPPISETTPGEKFTNVYTQDCRPLQDTTYLESCGIEKATLASPQFAGRILNQYPTGQPEGVPAEAYVHTAFPTFHEGRVVGLELKGEGVKGPAPESEFTRSVWLSNLPEGKGASHLVLSESPVDALSYAQLHPDERALYGSTAGPLTQNKIFELKRLLGEERIPSIKAAFGNDAQGHHYDTRLLAGFASEQNPMRVVREHPHLLTVEVTTTNLSGVKAVNEQLKGFNATVTQQYNQESGEKESLAIAPTLREELVTSARMGPNTYQFHVPMNREALGAFNEAINQQLQYDVKIALVKSQGTNWNQDLKQEQLQTGARKGLEAGENQYGLEPERWRIPPTAGGRNFLLEEEQARAKGERLVVVEFRESRDEVAQLPALRAQLEAAGLSLNHALNLEPREKREIGTALSLRYPIDSPRLPLISKALDSLTANPKATVLEAHADQAERRQVAAAQEQRQQQQQQAGPQIQPSDSPTQDQARQTFVQLAGPLAKELREAGAGLDAARLQELSKFLVKQPELRATDKENLEKVLTTISKSAELKESPAVQQLRQAVQVLEKPASAPQQKSQQPAQQEQQPRKKGPRL